jgi:long-chain acyl-CoA synthetase
VGYPIAGVEIAIAEDHEILIKAPYVMAGYYRDPDATRAVLDADGWLHTGDLGEFTADGALKITGCKKDLFKLSTGKYVTPLPLEEQLKQSTLVQQAVVVGAQRKFCAMLIFPNVHKLQSFAKSWGVDLALEDLLRYPKVLEHYQTLIDTANRSLPPWSTVKRFQLINQDLNVENGLLTPTLKLNRSRLNEVFATEIAALYTDAEGAVKSGMKVISPQRHPEREGDVMTDGATLVSYPDISVST